MSQNRVTAKQRPLPIARLGSFDQPERTQLLGALQRLRADRKNALRTQELAPAAGMTLREANQVLWSMWGEQLVERTLMGRWYLAAVPAPVLCEAEERLLTAVRRSRANTTMSELARRADVPRDELRRTLDLLCEKGVLVERPDGWYQVRVAE